MQTECFSEKFNPNKKIDARERLLHEGFSHYQLDIDYSETDQLLLFQEFVNLEEDPYASRGSNRFRRYGNGIILPWKPQEIHWIPTIRRNGVNLSGYDQGKNNPEHSDMRYFNSLSERVKNSNILLPMILTIPFGLLVGRTYPYILEFTL